VEFVVLIVSFFFLGFLHCKSSCISTIKSQRAWLKFYLVRRSQGVHCKQRQKPICSELEPISASSDMFYDSVCKYQATLLSSASVHRGLPFSVVSNAQEIVFSPDLLTFSLLTRSGLWCCKYRDRVCYMDSGWRSPALIISGIVSTSFVKSYGGLLVTKAALGFCEGGTLPGLAVCPFRYSFLSSSQLANSFCSTVSTV
jgi:hypothetical protein